MAKHVIHDLGPIWTGGADNEEAFLKGCYINSLQLAQEYNLRIIAFPNISAGVYGFPKDSTAQIAVKMVKDCCANSTLNLDRVVFVCFDDENYSHYKALI